MEVASFISGTIIVLILRKEGQQCSLSQAFHLEIYLSRCAPREAATTTYHGHHPSIFKEVIRGMSCKEAEILCLNFSSKANNYYMSSSLFLELL